MSKPLRVAFFPDSYLEVNGAAMTCRRLVDFAESRGFPMLCVHAGLEPRRENTGSVTHIALKRSPIAIDLDEGLAYDPLFQRHSGRVQKLIDEFKPDVIHITGMNDVSIIGAVIAWRRQIPMLGSWHTNLHEFAASRIRRLLRFLPKGLVGNVADLAERNIFKGAGYYYKMPKLILAPNQELIDELARRTGRKVEKMGRGVDTTSFDPKKRTANDGVFRFGFVGRLRAEKNVQMLIELERSLIEAGRTNFEFLIVGEGNVREELESKMKHAVFTGFLEGEDLAEAYANMDVFLFPSETDAFGNVAQEAIASGVPTIVSSKGGPKFIIDEGVTGFVADGFEDFRRFSLKLLDDRELLETMKRNARHHSLNLSWDRIFEGVYANYQATIDIAHHIIEDEKARASAA